jgi:hypothetical protein
MPGHRLHGRVTGSAALSKRIRLTRSGPKPAIESEAVRENVTPAGASSGTGGR